MKRKVQSFCLSALGTLSLFLLSGIFDYFNLAVIRKAVLFSILEEKPVVLNEYSHLSIHSKGFFSERGVQDFPVRGEIVYLRINAVAGRISSSIKLPS